MKLIELTDNLKEHIEHCSPAELLDLYNMAFDTILELEDIKHIGEGE